MSEAGRRALAADLLADLSRQADEVHPPCRSNPDLFFTSTKPADTRRAKHLCNGDAETFQCELRDLCRAYAITARERFGVWGGLSSADGHLLTEDADARLAAVR